MTDPRPHRGSLSTIGGWMIVIAATAVALRLVLAPALVFIAVAFELMVAVAAAWLWRAWHRGPIPGWEVVLWMLAFAVGMPIASIVSGAVLLYFLTI